MLDGAQGETMAKVVKTLVMYGDAFGAERMVPVTSKCGHTVISFGLKAIQPVYELYDQLIAAGLVSGQKFTADPRPIDPNVPSSLLEDIVFRTVMYTHQDKYEAQLKKLGILSDDGYTCTCYLDQVGNKPEKGDVLSWAESSAVVYANSVLGARCNRNSGIIELMGSVAGFVPEFGLLTDEGRKASWVVEVRCEKKPEAQLLGSAIGMKVMEDVPYVKGLDKWLGTELTDEACAYLKDFGAATASNGAVGLYHIDKLTPEAKELGAKLINRALLCRLPASESQPDGGMGRGHRRETQEKRPEPGLRADGVHRLPRRAARGREGRHRREAQELRDRAQLHLPADVHEQSPVQKEGRHHLLQQAAHLHQRALLHRERDPERHHA